MQAGCARRRAISQWDGRAVFAIYCMALPDHLKGDIYEASYKTASIFMDRQI